MSKNPKKQTAAAGTADTSSPAPIPGAAESTGRAQKRGTKAAELKGSSLPAAASTAPEAVIAPAPAPPPPETLREAVQTCLNKMAHVTNQKKLGDLLAIQDQLQKFLAIGHPILDRFCVPVSAEQEAAAQRKRMNPTK